MSALMKTLIIALATAVSAMPAPSSSAPPAPAATPDTQALYTSLLTAPSALERLKRLLVDPASGSLLSGDALRKSIVFDYNNGAVLAPANANGGKIAAAVAQTFPVLVEQDIGTVTAFLNPCSLLQPHTHPQIESLVVTEGNITSGVLIPGIVAPGQGTGEIVQTLTKYQGTVYPAGSIHYQVNPTCQPAVFVSSLPSSDPGTTLESTFFSLSGDVVATTLGFPETTVDGQDINAFRSKLPADLIITVEKCLSACKLPAR